MINFLQLHERAAAAARKAPREPGLSTVVLAPGTNYTRWLIRQGFKPTWPTGYAKAYVKALRENGELARVEPITNKQLETA